MGQWVSIMRLVGHVDNGVIDTGMSDLQKAKW
jgi:hypothetical protein